MKTHHPASYRSGLEVSVQAQLSTMCEATYEAYRIPYTKPVAHYTPDFCLPNGILIETKGLFDASDRTKHLLVKKQHPELDIRFVFQRSKARLYKGSPSTYADWCRKHGFLFADTEVPRAWVQEPATARTAIAKFAKP